MSKKITKAAKANGAKNPLDEVAVEAAIPTAGPNSTVLLKVTAGKVQSPKVTGDPLKNKEIKQALALADTLLMIKLFEANKKEVY